MFNFESAKRWFETSEETEARGKRLRQDVRDVYLQQAGIDPKHVTPDQLAEVHQSARAKLETCLTAMFMVENKKNTASTQKRPKT